MRKSLVASILIILLVLTSCTQPPTEAPPRATETPILKPSPGLVPTVGPLPSHGFVVRDKPFQFLGAYVAAQFEPWSKAKNADLIKSAKAHGIIVLQVKFENFEPQLGHYDEDELIKLDHLLALASENGIYVMPYFIQALGMALSPDAPYYHPGGIEGLVKDQKLKEAFKRRMAAVITRINTVNGRKYSEDPTILAWMPVQELVSAPENYPKTPEVTVEELAAWIEEMASYVKHLDPNHLVTINVHSGIAKVGEDWFKMLTVPSLDFVHVEDGEARLLHLTHEPVDFYLKVFELEKPVVMMISFTGGALDQAKIGNDYSWQSQTLKEVFQVYYEMGVAAGFIIYSWESEVDAKYPDKYYTYTASNRLIAQAFVDIAYQLGSRNMTTVPLGFVRLSH